MIRRLGNMGTVGHRIESLYNNCRGIAGIARNVLGTAKQGIRLLGRTNEFANRLGVSLPQINKIQSNLERFGNPTIDFVDSELQNSLFRSKLYYFSIIDMMIKKHKILDKCEAMTLLCTKASTHWSFVEFYFNIPLVLTSSDMCIINSISTDANSVKIPNIVVDAVSVLIMSLNDSVKASEKFEIFKKLSQQFMILSQEIVGIETDESCNIDKEKYSIILLKYDNLIQDCAFEGIPTRFLQHVAKIYTDADRYIPIQLNGTIGNIAKRISKDTSNNNIV